MDEDEVVDLFADLIAPKTMKKRYGGARIFLSDNGIRAIDRVGREISRDIRNVSAQLGH